MRSRYSTASVAKCARRTFVLTPLCDTGAANAGLPLPVVNLEIRSVQHRPIQGIEGGSIKDAPPKHDSRNALRVADVGEGISIDKQQIGDTPRLNRSDGVTEVHELGGYSRCTFDGLEGRHAELHNEVL